MNREIKFRVWLHDTKKWGDVACIEVFNSTGKLEYLYQDQPYTIQQYTGLKDKSGKEIYEGDIISGEFYDTEYHHSETIKAEVVFNNGAFNVAIREWRKPSLEVIGNIMQNPELIKN